MGHWSFQITGDIHGAQQNQPCIFYHNFTTLSQPHFQTGVLVHQNGCNINYPHPPELHESTMSFGVSRHPPPNLDLNYPPPSGHYSQYLEPPSCIGDFPIPVSHGISCFPVSSYSRNVPYMEDIRGAFKRKNAECIYQYHNASAGPSSSIPLMNVSETGSYGVMRSQPCVLGAESFLVHNTNQLIHAAPSIHIPGNHWPEMNYPPNDIAWRPVPLHYVHVAEYGAHVEPGNVAFQGFQVPVSNGTPAVLIHPPQHHLGHLNPHQPPLTMLMPRDAETMDLAASGYRLQGNTADSIAPRLHTLSQIRYLPEDETAILETPVYHESSTDQHRDMRLDIDHMSYEELLALEEEIGIVGTGLSEKFIRHNLKTRIFTPSAAPVDRQIDFCVICQSNYEEKGEIATLKCEHEYHSECLKKWLVIKNTCPICKATAFTSNNSTTTT